MPAAAWGTMTPAQKMAVLYMCVYVCMRVYACVFVCVCVCMCVCVYAYAYTSTHTNAHTHTHTQSPDDPSCCVLRVAKKPTLEFLTSNIKQLLTLFQVGGAGRCFAGRVDGCVGVCGKGCV